jgi:thiol-disulfide isomerase/thioredoxin
VQPTSPPPAQPASTNSAIKPERIASATTALAASSPTLSIPSGGIGRSNGPSLDMPEATVVPPACVLVGNRLESLVLRDLDGRPWDFKKDRRGKVVLLDFWYSTCRPCLNSIPDLVKLQGMYEPFGLQIIGLAYESGSFDEQARKVRATQSKLRVNYISLLGGGDNCPVRQQFDVHSFPSLVLVDEQGRILWRSRKGEGVSRNALGEAETEIRRRLNLPTR